jgi:hypothetical protein
MSLEILLEQKSQKTRKELKSDGWLSTKPGDFSRDTYDVVESSDGFLMYKSKGVGTTPPPPADGTSTNYESQDKPAPAPTSSPYEKWASVFKFTTEDDKEVRITFDNELISAIDKFKRAGFDEDDAFVRAVAETYPKIRFIHYLKGTANLKESVEVKGLSSLIVEQEYQTWTVMRAADGINFKLRPGKVVKQPSSLPGKPAPQQPQQPAEPAKPEGEEVLKKEQEVASKVAQDEKEGDKMFTTIQKRYINQYNQENWTTEKPLENLLPYTENINLKEKHPDVFKEDLFMYRAKTNTPDGAKAWAEKVGEAAITDQMITRGSCRTNIKVYYDIAMKNIAIGDEKLNNLAQIVTKCQDQIDNFNDFGLTKKRLYDLGNLQGERKKYKLNYQTNSRG